MSSSIGTGTIRTTTPAAYAAAIVWLLRKYAGLDITSDQATALVVAVLPIWYPIARKLADQFPVIGRLLFISNKTPVYAPVIDPNVGI